MKLIKLTDQKRKTKNNTVWSKGKTITISKNKRRGELCSSGVLHAYTNINLALLLNPIHANIDNPRIYEVEGNVVVKDFGKVGFHELKVIQELKLPDWFKNKEIRKDVIVQFSILCAYAVIENFEKVHPDDKRPRKAIEATENYLRLKSDAAESARSAAESAWSAAELAARSAESAAWSAWSAESAARSAWSAWSAESAARSARSAWSAESAARSARSAESAAWSAESAAWSAWSAESAAWSAAWSAAEINFAEIADKAVDLITGK